MARPPPRSTSRACGAGRSPTRTACARRRARSPSPPQYSGTSSDTVVRLRHRARRGTARAQRLRRQACSHRQSGHARRRLAGGMAMAQMARLRRPRHRHRRRCAAMARVHFGDVITVNSAVHPRAVLDIAGARIRSSSASSTSSAPRRMPPSTHRGTRRRRLRRPPYPGQAARPVAGGIGRRSRTIPSLVLRIAGSGPETERVREAAREAGLSTPCAFVGRIDDESRCAGSSRAPAVLVNPSAREGFGLVVAEAAAEGTPSVVVAGSGQRGGGTRSNPA